MPGRLSRRERRAVRTARVNERWTELEALREEMANAAGGLPPGRSVQAASLLGFASRLGAILGQGGPPESQEGPDRWCRECGLRLTASTPLSVHTGHIHKPIDHWIIDTAATVWAVAKVVADGGDQSGVEALRPRLSALGITEQAVEMFLRQNPAPESQEGER